MNSVPSPKNYASLSNHTFIGILISSINSLRQYPASAFEFEVCNLIDSVSVNICAHVFLFSDINSGNNVSKYIVVFKRLALYPWIIPVLYQRVIWRTTFLIQTCVVVLRVCCAGPNPILHFCANVLASTLE